MFRTGDTVVHPIYGICRIKAKTERILPETKGITYVLKPKTLTTGNLKIFIPKEKIKKSGIRYPLKKRKISHVFEILAEAPNDISNDSRKGYCVAKQKIHSGDSLKLAEMMRDLEKQKNDKTSLTQTRKGLLELAKGVLTDEIAYVKGISKQEADKLVDNALR